VPWRSPEAGDPPKKYPDFEGSTNKDPDFQFVSAPLRQTPTRSQHKSRTLKEKFSSSNPEKKLIVIFS
jgi:hypothetical protein